MEIMDGINDVMISDMENDRPDNKSETIIEMVKNLNDEMNSSHSQTYRKTSYWNQQGTRGQEETYEALLETLQGLESIVFNIEVLLRKYLGP